MKIIYLHGWGGTRNDAKLKILSKFGDEVKYPVIEYNKNKNLINTVADWLHNPETIIIGSSFGGYIAYYASVYAGKPALLINPSFFLKDGGELRPENWNHYEKEKHFIISKKDEILDIRRTLKFLNEIKISDENVTIYEDLTHRIPLDVFDNAFTEFRNKYFNIYKEEKEKKKKFLEEEKAKKIAAGFDPAEWWTLGSKPKSSKKQTKQIYDAPDIPPSYIGHFGNTITEQVPTETMLEASERQMEDIARQHDDMLDEGLLEF